MQWVKVAAATVLLPFGNVLVVHSLLRRKEDSTEFPRSLKVPKSEHILH